MGLPEIKYISQAEYLEAERLALNKHEYFSWGGFCDGWCFHFP